MNNVILILLGILCVLAVVAVLQRPVLPTMRDSHKPLPPGDLAALTRVRAEPEPVRLLLRPHTTFAAYAELRHEDGRKHSLIVICTTGGGPDAAITITNHHAFRACPPELGWTLVDSYLVDEHKIDANFYP